MKQLFSILFILCSLNSISQSFVTEDKVWSNVTYGSEYGSDYISYYLRFEGDTIRNNTTYKKILQSDDSLMVDWYFNGCIRETDTGTVYFLPKDSKNEEYLILDFGVNSQDTIKLTDEPDDYLVVDSVSVKPFGIYSKNRKHVYVRKQGFNTTWISGLGSILGTLHDPKTLNYVGQASHTVCFFENDSLKFHHEYYKSCFPTGKYTSVEDSFHGNLIRIRNSPNAIIFELPNEYQNAYFKIVDIVGKSVYSRSVGNETEIRLEKSQFDKGILIYILRSKGGSITGKFLLN